MPSKIIEEYGAQSVQIIDGAARESHGQERIEVVNPVTEQAVGSVAVADAEDVDAAVRSAHRMLSADPWAGLGVADRAHILRNLADAFERHGDEMRTLVTEENGATYGPSFWGNVVAPAGLYRYYADLIETVEVEEVRPAPPGASGHTIVRREPAGVAALICAWNVPQGITAMKLGPALAAGCTVVLKPAPETPFDSILLVQLAREAGVPDGVINVIFGDAETGRALIRHPLVRKVSFTGSPEAGRDVAVNAADTFTPVTLELGGKSAAILLDDADVSSFQPLVNQVCIAHSGQICALSTRLLVPRSRYQEVTEAVAATMGGLRLGDPFDQATEMGPVVSDRQRSRVLGYIESGVSDGARIATGGGRPAAFERGYYVEPTLLVNVENRMKVAQDEIFGPVLVAIPYDDVDDAVAIANDSRYGLGGTVFSADTDRAVAVARRLDTGTVGVNMYEQFFNAPFGGVKTSGFGRELGPEGLDPYFVKKSIYHATSLDGGEFTESGRGVV